MIRLATTDPRFETAFTDLLEQARDTTESVDQAVASIISDVRTEGDVALLRYTERFDRLALTPDRLRITVEEIDAAVAGISSELTAALDLAATRIEAFHRLQVPADLQTSDCSRPYPGNALDAA